MKINHWKLAELGAEEKCRILRRGEEDIRAAMNNVTPIIEDVRKRGDAALIDYAKKFDKADIQTIKANEKDFDRARSELSADIKDVIDFCAKSVRIHHRQQMDRVESMWMEEVRPGVYAGEKVTPVDSVGLYVPGGRGSFPSSLFMLAIPAVVAGVKTIAVCTPPKPDGYFDAATLYAAETCGIKNVFKAGGGQGIAALAYGTESVPKVAKVVGPGSMYVSAAKRILSDEIDPGMPAGASEAIILADESADPWNTALDMMNEAEHGADSAVVLVTDSEILAGKVAEHLKEIVGALPEERRSYCENVFSNYGGLLVCADMSEVINFCNEYAPEHLLVKVKKPVAIIDKLVNAGEILFGESTPSTLGNYGIGINHVLPTGQKGLSYSCTSVWDFLKRTSLSYVSPEGYQVLKGPVERLAEYEGFTGHADVLRKRNEDVFTDLDIQKKVKKV